MNKMLFGKYETSLCYKIGQQWFCPRISSMDAIFAQFLCVVCGLWCNVVLLDYFTLSDRLCSSDILIQQVWQ